MKTSELTGALLDYWVARIEGYDHTGASFIQHVHTYSSDWFYGGPIIEREEICIEPLAHFREGDHVTGWHAIIYYNGGEQHCEEGETPLIAAMRCYVASKFGDEVPDDVGGEKP